MAKNVMCYLKQSNIGDWYLIPEDNIDLWVKWLSSGDNLPSWAEPVDKSTCLVKFNNYIRK